MAIPDFQSIFKPLLDFIAAQQIVVMTAVTVAMGTHFRLTEVELNKKNAGGTYTFKNRVHWARQYLIFASLVEPQSRGCVRVTPLGLEWSKKKVTGFKISDFRVIPGFNERTRPRGLKTKIGEATVKVSIPGVDESELDDQAADKVPTEHTEIQFLLLKLGAEMSFDVWVARNDRSRVYKGFKLGEMQRIKAELPLQFDEATNSTIELIDVLWLSGKQIIAAFEIESTTSIYSGLLRMADLVAMQPNLNIPLFLVAPDARREKVFSEVNRPTFSRLTPKLHEICRYISFSMLRERLRQAEAFIKFLKPEFLKELSEACELDND